MKSDWVGGGQECASSPSTDKMERHNLSPLTSVASAGSPISEAPLILSQSHTSSFPPGQALEELGTTSEESRQRQRYWSTVLEPIQSPQVAKFHAAPFSYLQPISSSTQSADISPVYPTFDFNQSSQRTASLIENMLTSSATFEGSTQNESNEGATHERPVRQGPTVKRILPRPGTMTGAVEKRRVKCPLCPATFAQRGDMQRHFRVKGKTVSGQ